ncbi:hypothetical protein JOF29_007955 [Kribbella aluminosa]|uniref:Uncharacterized protein n=1 Tax=Kribbella aluminosa TaxID=416017 RepID=A0ABS4UYX9_9ACTN|nr:hypothetical protein [Kribbella aluminosa]MBP2356845.1 hypothetical protein [Kribbella aluminosa]
MEEPYRFETATEGERAAFDLGAEDALDASKWTGEDLVLILAHATDAAGRLLRESRRS